MAEITLTRGAVAIVDDADLELVGSRKWYANGRAGRLYAVRFEPVAGKMRMLYMHRVIMGAETGVTVDHINGDRLDNRRSNLRLATQSQNCANRRKIISKSGYKGIGFNSWKQKFYARVVREGHTTHLGYHDTAEEAARAYDRGARLVHGAFAALNFPEET